MWRHLNVTGGLDLISLDGFNDTKNTKTSTTILEFYNGNKCVPLTKQKGEFLALKTFRDRFGGL